ncbi:MAG: glycosyltransferase [Actinomycetota bacterium]|nr:glycosyltransferase [Actinomycetota bacterium]
MSDAADARRSELTRSRPAPELVSVVMPTYNGAATVEAQLEALASQTYEGAWELVVADNGSTDDTLEIVERWSPKLPEVRVVDVEERKGVSHTCNVGASAARGDFVVFCHQDDVADRGWLEAIARAAPNCDLVGGRLDYQTLNDPVTLYWRPPHRYEELPRAMGFLPYAVGANLGMWTEVFHELGGWSESYFMGGEDIDFCWRAQLASFRLCYAPDALIHYRYRSDLRGFARQIYRYAMAEPKLYKAYRQQGAPRNTRAGLRTWLWALAHLPDLVRSVERRGRWMRKVAFRWGRVRGSMRERVFYP